MLRRIVATVPALCFILGVIDIIFNSQTWRFLDSTKIVDSSTYIGCLYCYRAVGL